MGPVVFYVGFYFLVSALQLASSKVENYNGWKNSPNVQYHIQTDEGEERYFKYQTKSGQYRKEKRLEDGTVVGTYGWVDPNGYLRLRDYIADNQGYRILKTKMIYVGGGTEPATFGPNYASLQPPPQPHRFGGLPQNGYLPPGYQVSETSTRAPVVHETPAIPSTSLLSPYYSPASGTSTPAPIVRVNPSTPATSLLGPYYSSPDVQVSPDSGPSSTTPYPTPASSSPSVAIFVDPTPAPVAVYSSTPKPVAVNYVPSSDSSGGGHPSSNPLVIVRAPTDSPPRLPPVAGKFAFVDAGNNNFITETNKNKLFYRSEGLHAVDDGTYVGYVGGYDDNTYGEYDGVSTVQNGFRYYLPRHYHEEQSSPDGRDRTGSFGYVDPFGIRRVIYYNTSPGKGFVHKKNNRYVGFHSTPYDPRPNF